MALGNVVATRLAGGLGRAGQNEDAFCALLATGPAATDLALNTVAELSSVIDAEALGITAAYDSANTVLVHHHIDEFFRLAPEGRLFIMLAAQATAIETLADVTNTTNGMVKLLRDPLCAGKVRIAAIAYNPSSYSPTVEDGIDKKVLDVATGVYSGAVVNAQAIADAEEDLHRPVVILVEARGLTIATPASVINARLAEAPQVQLVALQDYDVSSSNALHNTYAAVGTMLGAYAALPVDRAVCCPGYLNIQDKVAGKFVRPAIANTLLSSVADASLNTLDDKALVVPRTFIGYGGVYISDDPTCIDDSDDFCKVALNRVIQKGVRTAYLTMVPHVNESVKVDSTTGYIAAAVCKGWQEEIENACANAYGDEVSKVTAFIDPAQNILSTSTLEVGLAIVPNGRAKTINITIGFKNPFTA